jgi:hypothetical protein
MTHWFDDGLPYPWNQSVGQEMFDTLTITISSPGVIDQYYKMSITASLPSLNLSNPVPQLWRQALEDIATMGGLATFCQKLREGNWPKLRELAARLLDIAGIQQFGTAFRVSDNALLTNWHVLHRRADEAPATAVSAEFGFDDDGRGGVVAASAVPCDPAKVVSDKANDWALIQASSTMDSEWPVIDMAAAAEPTKASAAFVVQHPAGQRKRVGIVRNQVSFVDDRVVQYLTDTDVGSLGSPVFDADGRLIALHHSGGRPTSVMGQPPITKNEGIRISKVAADLAAAGVSLI